MPNQDPSTESQMQERFSEIMSRAVTDEKISDEERSELESLANELGAKVEVGDSDQPCYWVCKRNNFLCNPDFPPPNCECVLRCI